MMVILARDREADKDVIIYYLWFLEVPFISFQRLSNLLKVYGQHLPNKCKAL